MAESASTYDEHPYTGFAYWFSHPDHLGVMGAMRGLATARAHKCRVLEIGCGDGANLLSLATLLPEAEVVGLDLSAVHVAQGRRVASDLGITNLALHQADVMDFAVEPQSFDYVIAHGIYSWIPPAARDALLALTARALTPSGVAVVSYNTLPGHYETAPLRQLLRYHTAPLTDPAAKIRQARSIGEAWCRHIEDDEPQRRLHVARRLRKSLAGTSNQMIRHDWLSEEETPVYFTDFVAHARRHGLDYLDNAIPSAQRPENLEEEARAMLARLPDPVRAQQYFDHFHQTRFRVTLLARGDAPRQAPLRLAELALENRLDAGATRPGMSRTPRVMVETASGPEELADVPARMALAILVEEAPYAVPMEALAGEVLARMSAAPGTGDPRFAAGDAGIAALLAHLEPTLIDLWRHDVIHLWRDPPPPSPRPRPETGALQRYLATRGQELCSLYHRYLVLERPERELLAALDGSADIEELVARFGPETIERLRELRMMRLLLG